MCIMILFLMITALPCFYDIAPPPPLGFISAGLFLSGIGGVIASYVNYFRAPRDEPVCNGMYHISRNPIYMSVAVMALGMAIACQSWLIFACLCLHTLAQHPIILEEERFCKKRYADAYRLYQKRTRRYI